MSSLANDRHPSPPGRHRSNGSAAAHAWPDDVGLVHDWLPVYAGAERVLEQMIEVFPESEVYSLIDFVPEDQRDFLQGKTVTTSFIQSLPFARRAYRYYLPFAPMAIEQFDLSEHDVVVSSSYAVAKGALTRSDQLHVSYVHSPIRYAWDLYHSYLKESDLPAWVRTLLVRPLMHYIRLFDAATAPRVDVFVANSQHVARRIWKRYRRRAHVIHPPVNVSRFSTQACKDDFYLTTSRLVSYKRVDLVVRAFNRMPQKKLVVIGDGPQRSALEDLAGPNVDIRGYEPDPVVTDAMQRAQAFVFAAEEDFGIVPVEAQSCGTPVIAYGKGGARETVVPGETGVFFNSQDVPSLIEAVHALERTRSDFDPAAIRAHAEQFSIASFRESFARLIESAYADCTATGAAPEPASVRATA